MTGQVVTPAVVLRLMKAKGSDRVVSLFTFEQGLLRAFARGAAKPNNSIGVALLPGVELEAELVPGRGRDALPVLKAAQLQHSHHLSRTNLRQMSQLEHHLELLDRCAPLGEPLPAVWELLTKSLAALPMVHQPLKLLIVYHLRVMAELGFAPDWSIPEGIGPTAYHFDPARARLLRKDEIPKSETILLTPEIQHILATAASIKRKDTINFELRHWPTIAQVLIAHAQHHLDWDPKCLRFLLELTAEVPKTVAREGVT